MKTFALVAKDHVGAEYTIGYCLAENEDEATSRARREFGMKATARVTSTEDEIIRTVGDLCRAENELTFSRLRRAA